MTPKQLQEFSVYVPPTVARRLFENPGWQPGGSWDYFFAAALFADISGFTPLAEQLASQRTRGAEELTAILNQVFEALISTAEAHGGRVVKFGGDALTIIWPEPADHLGRAAWRAVTAAFAMQTAMAAFTTVVTSQGKFDLRMKIGVSAGQVLEVHAGGVFDRWEYVLAGEPITRMGRAENLAAAGEIVVDTAIWQLVAGLTAPPNPSPPSFVIGRPAASDFYLLTHLQDGPPPQPLPTLNWATLPAEDVGKVAATLRGYMPGTISNLLEFGHRDMLAELKPMTICFINFTGLDYAADPDAASKLSNFVRDAQEVVYFYEGSLNKLSVDDKGSVLLALFGAPPFFHEDDEVRAAACALSLLKVATHHQLAARVGLAAGSVFAGPLGAPQRREYTVIGDTVNLAARIMQNAENQEVWVDGSASNQISRFFELTDLGLVTVKGKAEPRHLFRILREKEQDRQDTSASYLLTELTGRDKEMETINRLADRVWDGYGQILLLSGEAGIGKSRLAGEIVRRWLERGGSPHTGDCVSYGRHTPYLPWRGILGTIVGLSPRLSLEQRLTRLENMLSRLPLPVVSAGGSVNPGYWLDRLPLLAGILGLECADNELTRGLNQTLRRDNIFATIRAIVLAEARQRPTLLVLEDIHWSDELSLELAAGLAAELANAPIFLILVHRPLGNQIPTAYHRLQTMAGAAHLHVSELDPDASLKLVKNKLGVSRLPAPLANLIREKGQGNPFFTEELVNALQDMQALQVVNGRCELTGNLDKLELPDTVQKVVLARIERLQEEEKLTLKVAAAIGRTFQRDLLEAIHPWASGETLTQHLAHLQAEDFTRPESQDNDADFLFKHVITQEVAYETMLHAQRRQLHATIGNILEQRYSGRDSEVIDLLAYHFARSEDRPKALKYLQLAGQSALKGHANAAAISYFTDALAIATEIDNVKVRFYLLAGREQAYNQLGNRAAQADDLAEMEQLARAHGNPLQQIETGNRRVQLATNLGDYNTARQAARDTLTLTRQHNEPLWEARTLTNKGITCWRQGDYPTAQSCMQAALQSQGAQDDPQLKATSLNYLGLIYTQTAQYELARADYRQALNLYRASGDRGGEAGCANNIGLLEASLGNFQQAEQFYSQALSICHAIGDRLREGISLNTLGQVNTLLGQYALAREQLSHSLTIRQAIGDRRGEAFCLHDLGYLYLFSNRLDEAIGIFRSACNLRHELGETGNFVASLAALGEAHLTKGDVYLAQHCLQQAVDLVSQNSGSGEYPLQYVWWMHAQVCRIVGQAAAAQDALRQAYLLVKTKADRIQSPELKRSYLENVRVNAAIMADYERTTASD